MCTLKAFYISALSLTFGVLPIAIFQHALRKPGLDPHAYVERGDKVEERYEAYRQRVGNYYAALTDAVKKNAPDLLLYLQRSKSMTRGYQILPPIVPDASGPKQMAHNNPVAYSWPWTDHLIQNELREIVDSETELRRMTHTDSIKRRAILAKLVRKYEQQRRWLENINDHIQYNRFWQAAIAADRAGYDRETALYSAVVERQNILQALERVQTTASISAGLFNGSLAVADWTGSLRNREALLTRKINPLMQHLQIPKFVRLEVSNNDWVFLVPLYTDIEDAAYLAAVEKIIESTWKIEDDNATYRIQLRVTRFSSAELYADGQKPTAGEIIDIQRHLERFPSDSAVLTTGARITYVQGYSIVLGPQPIAPRTLAHEFGHILGFRDHYVRGYEDLGDNGFQVMEAVADPGDIMSASAYGIVNRSHFLQLLRARCVRSLNWRFAFSVSARR